MRPLLKCPGGKGKIVDLILERFFPKEPCNAYYEPFLGGGIVLLSALSRPGVSKLFNRFVVSDANPEFINVFQTVKSKFDDLRPLLIHMCELHSEAFYYKLRGEFLDIDDDVYRAAATLYINRTCFNGLWRVNSKGQVNTPWGKRKHAYINLESLKEISELLSSQDVRLGVGDFEALLRQTQSGDFVYLDPPYLPASKGTVSFTSYTRNGFPLADHLRLAWICFELDRKGVKWALSGSDSTAYRDLFASYHIHDLHAPRSIGRKAESRKQVSEIIVTNF